ncbi:hypothetical protein QET21_002898 [Listeria monocytogenes]|uniref:hypothetical protein n=1 Tax=Listeria monocytogenes TaxID=1639 RepID=UPI00085C2C75|nr:hypothetical protein [Listeria monocytogenes]EAG6333244.1 hypothetical protein [Listeria monocytogenes CFSAN002346]EAG6373380.1 hypothetical protein [Listeria monocytogenes CFSAN002356]EAC3152229.1 hypothetical protein [Listeria monocytogenes]EAC5866400.1 hypothetical protein [Listeria monocytogenes]EAC8117254.1 hypothetical protein [Listeria monocytogenes]
MENTIIYFYKDEEGNNVPFMHGQGLPEMPFPQQELEQINRKVPATKNNLYMIYRDVIYRLDVDVVFNNL